MNQTATMRRIAAVLVGTALGAVLLFSGVALAATTFTVTKTAPKGGATGIAPTANVKAFFNHDIKAKTVTSSSSTFKIRQQGTTTWLGATRSVNNTITPTSTNGSSESVATLNPTADLAPNTTYEVRVVGGSSGVIDVNGSALGTNKNWTFATAGTTATTPPDTTIDSGPDSTVANDSASFTFSSDPPNGSTTFQCSLDGSPFAACASPKEYPGPLSQGDHTFLVKAIDASGKEDPTPASRSWKVDTVLLTVVDHTPTGSPASPPPGLDTNVTATFSNAMDPSTITIDTFTLTRTGSSVPLAAQVTYDGANKTATLDPSSSLSDSANYTAVIKSGSDGVKDLQGRSLAQDFSWTFMPCSGGVVLPPCGVVLPLQSIEPRLVICA